MSFTCCGPRKPSKEFVAALLTARADQNAIMGANWSSCGAAYAEAARLAELDDEQSLEEFAKVTSKMRNLNKSEPMLGDTLLLTAAAVGNVGATELLLERGADVDLPNHAGFTALMAASRFGGANTVRILLLHRADVSLELPDGRTALDLALAARAEAAQSDEGYKRISASVRHMVRADARHRPGDAVALLQEAEDAAFEEAEAAAVRETEELARASVANAQANVDAEVAKAKASVNAQLLSLVNLDKFRFWKGGSSSKVLTV